MTKSEAERRICGILEEYERESGRAVQDISIDYKDINESIDQTRQIDRSINIKLYRMDWWRVW